MSTDPAQFVVWSRTRRQRDIDLGRLSVPSGQLALRDVYDTERPQIVFAVPPGIHRVWATEVQVSGRWKRQFSATHLSVGLSDAAPARIDSPDALCLSTIRPYGLSFYTDLGIVVVHDTDAITPADMVSLDADFERAWDSPSSYSTIRDHGGATAFTCKTDPGPATFPILASFDSADRPVALHLALGTPED